MRDVDSAMESLLTATQEHSARSNGLVKFAHSRRMQKLMSEAATQVKCLAVALIVFAVDMLHAACMYA